MFHLDWPFFESSEGMLYKVLFSSLLFQGQERAVIVIIVLINLLIISLQSAKQ